MCVLKRIADAGTFADVKCVCIRDISWKNTRKLSDRLKSWRSAAPQFSTLCNFGHANFLSHRNAPHASIYGIIAAHIDVLHKYTAANKNLFHTKQFRMSRQTVFIVISNVPAQLFQINKVMIKFTDKQWMVYRTATWLEMHFLAKRSFAMYGQLEWIGSESVIIPESGN